MTTNANRTSVTQGPPGYVDLLRKKINALDAIRSDMNYPGKNTAETEVQDGGRAERSRAALLKRWSKHLVGDLIVDKIAGGMTLTKVLALKGMPTRDMIRNWRDHNWYNFDDRLRAAELLQADAWADEIIEIVDNETLDPQARRIRFDGRKWLMSRRSPGKYGERLTVAGDPNAPLRINVGMDLAELSDSELAALEAFIGARAEVLTGQVIDVESEEVIPATLSDTPPESS